jgi:hypothetical protein
MLEAYRMFLETCESATPRRAFYEALGRGEIQIRRTVGPRNAAAGERQRTAVARRWRAATQGLKSGNW